MYFKVVRGPLLDRSERIGLQASIWHNEADFTANMEPYRTEWFWFPRTVALIEVIATDPVDGWPMLDDGTRAPADTAATALAEVYRTDLILPVLRELTALAPAGPAGGAARASLTTLLQDRVSQLLGRPYLPAGRDWKRIMVPSISREDVRQAIRNYYRGEVARQLAAAQLESTSPIPPGTEETL